MASVRVVNQGPAVAKPSVTILDISDSIPLSQQLEPYERMLLLYQPIFLSPHL